MLSTKIKASIIINLFAIAHSLVVILFKHLALKDEIALTILTIVMVIWVTRLFTTPIEVSGAIALLCCFAGFYLGTKGAEIIGTINNGNLKEYSNILTTFIVTQIIGWATFFIVSKRKQ